ncbi:Light-harvesting complex-like protein OHP2 chloroplastic [Bienertia sinuspersici]
MDGFADTEEGGKGRGCCRVGFVAAGGGGVGVVGGCLQGEGGLVVRSEDHSLGHNEKGIWAMFGFAVGMLTEYATGSDFVDQVKLILSNLGIVDLD